MAGMEHGSLQRTAQIQQDLLNRAQAEYLKGSWSEAQALLEQQIRRNPDDVESLLLLASVFPSLRTYLSCHVASWNRLRGWRDAERWQLEMQRERAILDRRRP